MSKTFAWIIVGALAYLAGAFPSGIVMGRLFKGVDIRRHGSGNPGATNALRVLGPLPGAIIFALDFGKGLAAAVLPAHYLGRDYGWLGGLMAVIGHIYPVYAGFRGGKGLAAGCGALAFLYPWFLAVFAPVWAVVYLWRRHTALASASAIVALAIAAAFILRPWPLAATIIALAVIFWRHWPEAKKALSYQL